MKMRIYHECGINIWYFLREVVKIGDIDYNETEYIKLKDIPLDLNIYGCIQAWIFNNGLSFWIENYNEVLYDYNEKFMLILFKWSNIFSSLFKEKIISNLEDIEIYKHKEELYQWYNHNIILPKFMRNVYRDDKGIINWSHINHSNIDTIDQCYSSEDIIGCADANKIIGVLNIYNHNVNNDYEKQLVLMGLHNYNRCNSNIIKDSSTMTIWNNSFFDNYSRETCDKQMCYNFFIEAENN